MPSSFGLRWRKRNEQTIHELPENAKEATKLILTVANARFLLLAHFRSAHQLCCGCHLDGTKWRRRKVASPSKRPRPDVILVIGRVAPTSIMHEVSGAFHLFHSLCVLDRLLVFRSHIGYQPHGSRSASDPHAVFKTPRADLILVISRMSTCRHTAQPCILQVRRKGAEVDSGCQGCILDCAAMCIFIQIS